MYTVPLISLTLLLGQAPAVTPRLTGLLTTPAKLSTRPDVGIACQHRLTRALGVSIRQRPLGHGSAIFDRHVYSQSLVRAISEDKDSYSENIPPNYADKGYGYCNPDSLDTFDGDGGELGGGEVEGETEEEVEEAISSALKRAAEGGRLEFLFDDYDGTADISLLTRRRKARLSGATTARPASFDEKLEALPQAEASTNPNANPPSEELNNNNNNNNSNDQFAASSDLGGGAGGGSRSQQGVREGLGRDFVRSTENEGYLTGEYGDMEGEEELVPGGEGAIEAALERAADEGRLDLLFGEYDGTADISLLTRRRKERLQQERQGRLPQPAARSQPPSESEMSDPPHSAVSKVPETNSNSAPETPQETSLPEEKIKMDMYEDSEDAGVAKALERLEQLVSEQNAALGAIAPASSVDPPAKAPRQARFESQGDAESGMGDSVYGDMEGEEESVPGGEGAIEAALERAADEGRLDLLFGEYDGTADISLLTRRRKERLQQKQEQASQPQSDLTTSTIRESQSATELSETQNRVASESLMSTPETKISDMAESLSSRPPQKASGQAVSQPQVDTESGMGDNVYGDLEGEEELVPGGEGAIEAALERAADEGRLDLLFGEYDGTADISLLTRRRKERLQQGRELGTRAKTPTEDMTEAGESEGSKQPDVRENAPDTPKASELDKVEENLPKPSPKPLNRVGFEPRVDAESGMGDSVYGDLEGEEELVPGGEGAIEAALERAADEGRLDLLFGEYDGTADISLLTRRRKERLQQQQQQGQVKVQEEEKRDSQAGSSPEAPPKLQQMKTEAENEGGSVEQTGNWPARSATQSLKADEGQGRGRGGSAPEVPKQAPTMSQNKNQFEPQGDAESGMGDSVYGDLEGEEELVPGGEGAIEAALERAADEGRLDLLFGEYDGTADISLLTRRRKERIRSEPEGRKAVKTETDARGTEATIAPTPEGGVADGIGTTSSKMMAASEGSTSPPPSSPAGGETPVANEGNAARDDTFNKKFNDVIESGDFGVRRKSSRPPSLSAQRLREVEQMEILEQRKRLEELDRQMEMAARAKPETEMTLQKLTTAPSNNLNRNIDGSLRPDDEPRVQASGGKSPMTRSYEERQAKMMEMANVTDYQKFRKTNYKPKVSTWGVFERPKDISKAYGGGRTIKKGEYDKWLEEQSKVLTKRLQGQEVKIELNDTIDKEKEMMAQKNISIAFTMLESAQLYEAKSLFEDVRRQFPFRTKIAGRATYGLAMSLDALGQTNRAQDLYRSLRFHPNMDIKKSAKTMLSGFQAMEFFKVGTEDDTDYSKFDRYFQSMGRVSRYDLSSSTVIKRTEADIENERKDILLSILIFIGLFALPTILIGWFRFRIHAYPLTPFGF